MSARGIWDPEPGTQVPPSAPTVSDKTTDVDTVMIGLGFAVG